MRSQTNFIDTRKLLQEQQEFYKKKLKTESQSDVVAKAVKAIVGSLNSTGFDRPIADAI